MNIHFHPEAEHEYHEAAQWYGQQRFGLDAEFLTCVDETLQRIVRHPEMYPVVHNQKRRAVVRRFPYAIFFERGENELRILSIFHSRRNPEIWKSRTL